MTLLSQFTGVRPRRKYVRIMVADSPATVSIPSWAQGGRGLVYVTGCGGGGGGNTNGGSSGASANQHLILIPSGETTMSVTAGAAGTGGGSPTAGGDTKIGFAADYLRLGGGGADGPTVGSVSLWDGASWRSLSLSALSANTTSLATGAANATTTGGASPFGTGAASGVASVGYGGGGGASANGGPGFVVLEFVEGE